MTKSGIALSAAVVCSALAGCASDGAKPAFSPAECLTDQKIVLDLAPKGTKTVEVDPETGWAKIHSVLTLADAKEVARANALIAERCGEE